MSWSVGGLDGEYVDVESADVEVLEEIAENVRERLSGTTLWSDERRGLITDLDVIEEELEIRARRQDHQEVADDEVRQRQGG